MKKNCELKHGACSGRTEDVTKQQIKRESGYSNLKLVCKWKFPVGRGHSEHITRVNAEIEQ
jgi:hypothetical protein